MKAIAAMSLNRVIGRAGAIPWHLPEDFRWFKRCTSGQVVLMGRKTWDSLGKPLPNRRNMVVTRQSSISGVETISDLASFNSSTYVPQDVWVIGGAEIYRQLLPLCTDLYLSVVLQEVEGDAFFPEFESRFRFIETVLSHPEFEVRHYRNSAQVS